MVVHSTKPMKKRTLVNIFLVFYLLFMVIYSTDAADNYIVRVIYFKPSDAKEVSHVTYNKIIKDIQEFFKSEMIRHGFGDKTFKIETNADGTLKIHTVKGRHSGDYYKGEVFTAYYDKVSKEIPFHINNTTNRAEQDNIYIVILGGVEVSEHGMTWGGGWTFYKAIGGCAVISETARKLYPHHYTSLIAHEFTHAFGIKHNTDNKSLMGTLPYGGPSHILDFEARLLNKHHLFNDSHTLNTPPQITSDLTIRNIDAENISLEAQVRSGDDLYHCQVHTGQDYVGSDALHGRSDTIRVKVPRGLILNGRTLEGRDLEFDVYDVNGNRGQKSFHNIQLPEPLLVDRDIMPIDTEGTQQASNQSNIKYLVLTAENDNSIRAINRSWQWGQHLQSTWEKPFGGTLPSKPEGFVHPSHQIADYHTDKWDTFFYSHANSLVIWNISELEYNTFDCYLYLPNPCGNIAAFEIRFLADHKEIYKIKEARVKDQGKHITFHIPKNANLLFLEVFDLGDSACDHYLLANPHLRHVEVYSAPSKADRRLVTTWSQLKIE